MIIKQHKKTLCDLSQIECIDLKSLIKENGTIRINIDEEIHLTCKLQFDTIVITIRNKANSLIKRIEVDEWFLQGGYTRTDIQDIIEMYKQFKYKDLIYIYNIQVY